MEVKTQQPIFGLEDRVLQWSGSERAALTRAINILDEARDLIDPESELGMDLGKAEAVLREYDEETIVLESHRTLT